MRNHVLFIALSVGLVFSPALIFAGGKCELSIENNTGAYISQIIIEENGSKKGPEIFYRNLGQNASTTIKVKKGALYDIVLVDTDEKHYAKRRLAWDTEEAGITFRLRDVQDQNLADRLRRVLLWPWYL